MTSVQDCDAFVTGTILHIFTLDNFIVRVVAIQSLTHCELEMQHIRIFTWSIAQLTITFGAFRMFMVFASATFPFLK